METMIWLLLWTLALAFGFLLGYRYGSGRPFLGFALSLGLPSAEPKTLSRHKDVDPVCHEGVRAAHARPSVHEGKIYYFCSRECREIFEAAPQLYIHGSFGRGSAPLKQSSDR